MRQMYLLTEGWRGPGKLPPRERSAFWSGCGCGIVLAVPALGVLLATAAALLRLLG